MPRRPAICPKGPSKESAPLVRLPDECPLKFKSPIRRGMRCRDAAVSILSLLMDVMERNIKGVLQDSNTEFLHDFRVSTRRIRAALSQIKGAFPQRETSLFRNDFKLIGRLTNSLRDIDVMLMSQAEYAGMLPDGLKPGLKDFFSSLELRRKEEYSKLAAELSSPEYARTFKKWRSFLKASDTLPSDGMSSSKVEDAGEGFILRRIAKMAKMAGGLDDDSSEADIHAFRIECKKLRYLLEFFGPAFSKGGTDDAVKRLKRLQDLLGGMNDLAVQRRLLMEGVSKLHSAGRGSPLSAAALGCLVSKLSKRRERLGVSFRKELSKFTGKKSMDSFSKIFSPKDS